MPFATACSDQYPSISGPTARVAWRPTSGRPTWVAKPRQTPVCRPEETGPSPPASSVHNNAEDERGSRLRVLTARAFRSLPLAPCADSPAPPRPAYLFCLPELGT
jgi:hypothetical protein